MWDFLSNLLNTQGENKVEPVIAVKVEPKVLLTVEQITRIINTKNVEKLNNFIKYLPSALEKYSINTPLRINHFLAQCSHESGEFSIFVENLNYNSKGLRNVFSKYFTTDQMADSYARQPEKIANLVYSNRMGNGSVESGDGFKYRGRGIIQITGRENYNACGQKLGQDFINHPELLETVEYAILTACEYWTRRNINADADNDDIIAVTKKVNGGTNGLDNRKLEYARIKSITGT